MRRGAHFFLWSLRLAPTLLALTPAQAGDSPYVLYAAGRYDEAIRAGEAAKDAAGLAIAARAVLAQTVIQERPCMPCLERAEAYARSAVAADPRYADGQVWLAVALGYQARLTGPLRARLKGDPDQAKEAIVMAVKDDPANPYALAALGGWNIELVRLGGGFLARKVFGADEAAGLALFDRAVKAAPGNVAVHYQVALALAGYDKARFENRIRAQLAAALAATPATAYERFVRGRAADLLAGLKPGDDPDFAAKVRKYQGYP